MEDPTRKGAHSPKTCMAAEGRPAQRTAGWVSRWQPGAGEGKPPTHLVEQPADAVAEGLKDIVSRPGARLAVVRARGGIKVATHCFQSTEGIARCTLILLVWRLCCGVLQGCMIEEENNGGQQRTLAGSKGWPLLPSINKAALRQAAYHSLHCVHPGSFARHCCAVPLQQRGGVRWVGGWVLVCMAPGNDLAPAKMPCPMASYLKHAARPWNGASIQILLHTHTTRMTPP